MIDALLYKLSDAEHLLSISRDTLLRFERAGLIATQGKNHGKRVTGASLRALAERIEQGEDIWAALASAEANAVSAPKRTARARSTKTSTDDGGTSHRHETDDDSPEYAPLQSKPPSWYKEST